MDNEFYILLILSKMYWMHLLLILVYIVKKSPIVASFGLL
jgi:hypothetical protein